MREKSEVTQRQWHSAKTTLGVAIMMQGMLRIKRKVPGSSSLVRCDGPSVCSARSFTRKELHWNCSWMRTMTWVFPPTPSFCPMGKKLESEVKSWTLFNPKCVVKKLWTKSCTFSSRLQWIQSGFWGLVKKIGQKVQLLTSNFFLTRRYKVA